MKPFTVSLLLLLTSCQWESDKDALYEIAYAIREMSEKSKYEPQNPTRTLPHYRYKKQLSFFDEFGRQVYDLGIGDSVVSEWIKYPDFHGAMWTIRANEKDTVCFDVFIQFLHGEPTYLNTPRDFLGASRWVPVDSIISKSYTYRMSKDGGTIILPDTSMPYVRIVLRTYVNWWYPYQGQKKEHKTNSKFLKNNRLYY